MAEQKGGQDILPALLFALGFLPARMEFFSATIFSRTRSSPLRHSSFVIYLAVDAFLPLTRSPDSGFAGFLEEMDRREAPVVWITGRSRMQIDEPRRRLGHTHPFVAEAGSGIFLPEDYFHLRVERSVRLGRFVCLPLAEPQPAAAEALENLVEATGVSVVTLRSLSPRELAQNTGLPAREAELVRQRDFEELFFFAGADDRAVARFRAEAQRRKLVLHEIPPLWSLSVGASPERAIKQLAGLYDRALRSHAAAIGVSASGQDEAFLRACDRNFLLARRPTNGLPLPAISSRIRTFSLQGPDTWSELISELPLRS